MEYIAPFVTIFQSLQFSLQRVADNKEVIEPIVPSDRVEVIPSKVCGCHHELVDRNGIAVGGTIF